MDCRDCRYRNRCLEYSRMYPCRDFKRKGPPVAAGQAHEKKNYQVNYKPDQGGKASEKQ